jgi:hypothetical protein
MDIKNKKAQSIILKKSVKTRVMKPMSMVLSVIHFPEKSDGEGYNGLLIDFRLGLVTWV